MIFSLFHGRLFSLVAGALVLAGCVLQDNSPPVLHGPSLPSAALPELIPGETYGYSDGRIDTVISVDGERVTWRNRYGVDVVSARNFVIPPLSWQSRTRKSVLETDAPLTHLWPLKTGTEGPRFATKQLVTWTDGSGRTYEGEREWQCAVQGTATVTVPVGTFDTFKINCYRYYPNGSIKRQTRSYYYAPALNHYVKREDTYLRGRGRTADLVSAGFNSTIFPADEQRDLTAALFKVLDQGADGKTVTWRRPNGMVTVGMTPLKSYNSESGAVCRQYESAYAYAGRTRTNVRDVCKTNDGGWRRVFFDADAG